MKKSFFIMTNNSLFINQHLIPLIKKLKNKYDLYLLTSETEKLNIIEDNIRFLDIQIRRKPSIINDIKTLFKTFYYIYYYKPLYLLSFTPKAGLISSLIAILKPITSVKHIHYFTGQVWATPLGLKKTFLKLFDVLTINLCNKTFCDSQSQIDFLIANLPISSSRIPLLVGNGSVSGVDLKLFYKPSIKEKKILRESLGINSDKFVLLYVGRINKYKGIKNLIKIFKKYSFHHPNDILICVGPCEDQLLKKDLINNKKIIVRDFEVDIHKYYKVSDILIFPSYREGFGSASIEAAACGLPIVGSNIPGLKDSIQNGKNGYLVNKDNVDMFVDSLLSLRYSDLYYKFSNNSIKFAKDNFEEEMVVNNLIKIIEIV